MYTEVKCSQCDVTFTRRTKEVKRVSKLGRLSFCGKECLLLGKRKHHGLGNDYFVKNKYKRQPDELSPFRWFVQRARHRNKDSGKECLLSAEYLSSIWDAQEGKCLHTGWALTLPASTGGWTDKEYRIPDQASLGRIDSTRGYVEGNVEFVALIYNYAKNSFSSEQVIWFCDAVAKQHSNRAESS